MHDQATLAPQGGTGVSSDTPALPPSQTSGALGRILGAVGLGGATAAAGVAATRSNDGGATSAPTAAVEQPTITTGTDSYTAPTRSGPPPAHHRKESIPTTAYPAGPESAAPVSSPVGGTRDDTVDAQNDGGFGRGATLAGVGLGAAAGAAGAAALGARGNRSGSPVPGDVSAAATSDTPMPAHGLSPTEKSGDAKSYTSGGPGEDQSRRPLEGSGVDSHSPAPLAGGIDQGTSTGPGAFHSSSALPGTALSTPGPTSQPAPTAQEGTSGWGPDPRTISGEQEERQSGGHGKAAAAGIAGAGAGAAGIVALQQRGDSDVNQQTETWPRSQGPAQQDHSTASTGIDTSKPHRADNATGGPTTSDGARPPAREESHAGRNAALAGVAGAGAGAYAAHEYSQRGTGQETTPTTSDKATTGSSREAAVTESLPLESAPTAGRSSGAGLNQAQGNDDSRTLKDPTTAAAAGAAASGTRRSQQQDYSRGNQATDDMAAKSRREDAAVATKDREKSKTEKISQTAVGDEAKKEGTRKDEDAEGHAGGKTAAAAAAGGGAYAAHATSDQRAEEDAGRRKQDLEEQEAARQKQYEKDQKAAEKLAAKEAKQHEKEAKKAEKQHSKEVEREEKKQQKVEGGLEDKYATGYDKAGEKEREEGEDRRGKEAAVVAGAGAAAGVGTSAAYGAHGGDEDAIKHEEQERSRLHKSQSREKKPNIFKRIFKSRKNKETGEEEQYSTDEEDTGAGDTQAERHKAGDITHSNTAATSSHENRYEAASGGAQKPSYNPLNKDEPSLGQRESDRGLQRGDGDAATGSTGPFTTAQDPEAARGLSTSSGGPGNDIQDKDTKTAEYEGQGRRRSQGEGVGGQATEEGDEQRKESLGHRMLEQLKPLPTAQQRRQF